MKLKVVIQFEQSFTPDEIKAGMNERVEQFKRKIKEDLQDEYHPEKIDVRVVIE